MNNNNHLVGNLPKIPNPALKKLDRLIGTWKQSDEYTGVSSYEWTEGGFFSVHHFDAIAPHGGASRH